MSAVGATRDAIRGSLQVYQELCQVHKTFRDRSENVAVSVEVTLQPWHAFKPDGVVLFSDILTPLTGMGIPFDIVTGKGPIIESPIRTLEDVESVKPLDAEGATPYVGGALRQVRLDIGLISDQRLRRVVLNRCEHPHAGPGT